MTQDEAKALSALLFKCRESLQMWADVVERQSGRVDRYTRGLVAQCDSFRSEQGWSPDGWGNEVAS